jgi:hypothetical protein
MGLACQNYMSSNDDQLPYGYAGRPSAPPQRSFQKRGVFSEMLPYMEEQATFDLIQFEYGVNGIPNAPFADPVANSVVAAFICPSWNDPLVASGAPAGFEYQNGALATYAGVGGSANSPDAKLIPRGTGTYPVNGAFTLKQAGGAATILPKRRKGAEITDGQSQSFLIGEFIHRDCPIGLPCDLAPGNVRPWYLAGFQQNAVAVPQVYCVKELEFTPNTVGKTRAIDGWNRLPLGSYHPGVTQFANIDGSVRIVSDDISVVAYRAAATVDGGEVER